MLSDMRFMSLVAHRFGRLEFLNICCCFLQAGALEKNQNKYSLSHISAAASGWAGWALAHPEFGSLVNPITTKGERLCPPHYC